MSFRRLALAAALAMSPVMAAAQTPAGAGRPLDLGPSRTGGVEVGVSSMIVAIFPTIGGQVSIPASRHVRVEFAAHTLPWLFEDSEDVGLLTQVQVRVPFRAGPPGSRRSLLLGVTSFTIADHLGGLDDSDTFDTVRPHAGVSWQWQKSGHVDVRIDLQGVFTGETPVFVVPLATFSMIWHRERGCW
jgi:hypothetical protein